MPGAIHITSTKQFEDLLKSNTHVIVDFHATWCGPCHAVAPIYEQLATKNSVPNSITFVKVDVDAQPEIAAKHSISAMPTFLFIKNGVVESSVRGANPPALKKAAEAAAADAKALAEKKTKPDEAKNEGPKSEETVSGSYSVSKGEGWKMSLK
ncbi:thioredoxin-domain-containing protein [Tothia fuscella]|uniref:Thioredoxin-domain-containing protein n=1 Tax=Tothia fuscella TaxID=1048955 RepID=A0A9P4TVD8_9PEZI|nr:thioredoxin-domain-containing protein [Tothia fuscella]